jgi:hypothetical protein
MNYRLNARGKNLDLAAQALGANEPPISPTNSADREPTPREVLEELITEQRLLEPGGLLCIGHDSNFADCAEAILRDLDRLYAAGN